MITNCYRITDDSDKALERVEEFLKPWQQGKDNYWVDIQAYEIDELEAWLHNLNLYDFAMRRYFEVVGGLSRPFLDLKGLTAQFQFAPSNAHAADQNVDRLEKTITGIRQRFDMNQQEKTNRRLAILTILSAIFMPVTLITGIYGMGFDNMPELHLPFAYPAVLIIMALIGGGMYMFFKTRGWPD